ncbi:MAG: MATE family efflux transporter [Planctomycetes bacterium]|nr:MATE family efflux transporter [Planctomycetota bacterium]
MPTEPAVTDDHQPSDEPADSGSWWSRPCGGRYVLAIAMPLVISTASWTVMNFIDRMFLLWHDKNEMAAALPAGMLLFALICFPLGVASYVNTFVAQYVGAGRPKQVGRAVWQAVFIGLVSVPLLIALAPLAEWFFFFARHDPAVAVHEVAYLQVLTFGAGAMVISAAMSSFFTGRGKTRTVMIVDSTAALLNIVLDYLWIFGNAGCPELGIAGAAWATVVSQWFKVAWYWWLMMRPEHREAYGMLSGRRIDWPLMGRLLRYGGPNGLQLVIDVAAFTVFILLIGQLGPDAMLATTLAFNVNSVAFVPMFGVGIAVSTIVGQQLGRNRPDLAARATWTAFTLAATYTGIMALLYITIPDVFLFGHAAGIDAAQFAPLRDTVVVLLRFVAVYCVFDAMNIIFVSAIKGAGDTRFILLTAIITSPLPVIVGYLGVWFFAQELLWCWVVLTGWIVSLGLIYFARFRQGRWRTMRVIDPELVDVASTETVATEKTEDHEPVATETAVACERHGASRR